MRSLVLHGLRYLFRIGMLSTGLSFAVCAQQLSFQHFSLAQGLPQVTVTTVMEDGHGFLWVGTMDGLARLTGSRFQARGLSPQDAPLPSRQVLKLMSDGRGGFWIFTGFGFSRYDLQSDRIAPFVTQHLADTALTINSATVDRHQRLWLTTARGLFRVDPDTLHIELIQRTDQGSVIVNGIHYAQTQLWVLTNKGLQIWDEAQHEVHEIVDLPEALRRKNLRFIDHNDDLLYIAAEHELLVYQQGRGIIRRWSRQQTGMPENPASIVHDVTGRTWIGGLNGLSYALPDSDELQRIEPANGSDDGLPSERITALWQGLDHSLWVATDTAGLARLAPGWPSISYLTRDLAPSTGGRNAPLAMVIDGQSRLLLLTLEGNLYRYALPNGPGELLSKHLISMGINSVFPTLLFDQQGHLWLASAQGLQQWRESQRNGPLMRDNLWTQTVVHAVADPEGAFWLAYHENSVARVQVQSRRVDRFPGPLSAHPIVAVALDGNNLWALHRDLGLSLFNRDSGQLLRHLPSRCHSSNPLPTDLKRLGDDIFMVAGNGSYRVNVQSGACETHTDNSGPGNNVGNALVIDSHHQLWLTTNSSVALWQAEEQRFQWYGAVDGLPATEFVLHSAISYQNTLLLGTMQGVISIDTRQWPRSGVAVPIHLSALRINDSPVSLRIGPRTVGVEQLQHLLLQPGQSFVDFDYAAQGAGLGEEIEYSTRLLGLREQWSAPERSGHVAYTALNPGNYHLEIHARRRGDEEWGPTRSVKIVVAPQWWQTLTVRIVASLLLIVLPVLWFALRSMALARQKLRLEVTVAHRTAHIEHLLAQRTRLFAHIAHELRTPLTLILAPVHDLLNKSLPAELQRQSLRRIEDSATRLQHLVESSLDFARIEHSVQNSSETVVIAHAVKQLVSSYQSLAEAVDMRIVLHDEMQAPLQLSAQLIDAILGNLLNNALKYAARAGEVISVTIRGDSNGGFNLVVSDRGPGIAANLQQKIFEPFYRLKEDKAEASRYGYGLGLAYVRELVQQLKGNITLTSEPGAGSTFSVYLQGLSLAPNVAPALKTMPDADVLPAGGFADKATSNGASGDFHESALSEPRHSLMLVEDHLDMANYLRELFAADYRTLVVDSAEEALQLAQQHLPDVVITDIRLPDKDGYWLCQQLRQTETTSHIPIIVLSAFASIDKRLQGLAENADDFIGKPFHPDELRLRVANLLARQEIWRKHVGTTLANAVDKAQMPPTRSGPDQRFIERLHGTLEQHFSQPEFDVEALAEALYLSQKQLERKVKALTAKTPVEYLREFRIGKAMALLRAGERVNTTVYAVGYNSATYFSTTFKAATGMSPKTYRDQHQESASRDPAT